MIINFSVKNFGCIKDEVTLSFEANKSDDLEDYYIIEPKKGLRLLKLGLIFGPNASGKTTVLRALDFLRRLILNPLQTKTDTFDFKPFLFDLQTPSENTTLSIEFIQKGIKFNYKIELNQNYIVKELLEFYNPRNATVFERITIPEKQLSQIRFGSKFSVKKSQLSTLENNTLWNNTVFGGYLKTNFESDELKNVIDWFRVNLVSLIMPTTDLFSNISDGINKKILNKENIVNIIKKADFNIADIAIEEKKLDEESLDRISTLTQMSREDIEKMKANGSLNLKGRTVFFKHKSDNGNFYNLGYAYQSEGTKRYYQFSGLLDMLIRYPNILPIDELESSLHPDLLEHFLLTFLVNSKNSQLIATTHHRELLMKKDILRPDAIWFTEKKPDGGTDLYSLDDFDTSVIRPDTGSIYNAYKIGKLGATPNLGDYYIDLEDGKA